MGWIAGSSNMTRILFLATKQYDENTVPGGRNWWVRKSSKSKSQAYMEAMTGGEVSRVLFAKL